MVDILGKYEAEKKEQGTRGVPDVSKELGWSSRGTQRFFSNVKDVAQSVRESQLPILVVSGVMLVFSLFILFDFIAPAPVRVEPLPVGAFPTLELRRTSALDSAEIAER